MVAYVPALSLLVVLLIISLVLLNKISGEQLPTLLEAKNVLLLFAASLFCLLLVVHLFKEQSWTADLLKVVAGVLAGAVATLSASTKGKAEPPSMDHIQTAVGTEIQLAGRDIIGKMEGDIRDLRDSVVNQYQTIQEALGQIRESTSIQHPMTKRRMSFYFGGDERVIADLKQIADARADDWTQQWIARCLADPRIKGMLDAEINHLRDEGWVVTEIGFDNHRDGIHVNVDVQRPFFTSA